MGFTTSHQDHKKEQPASLATRLFATGVKIHGPILKNLLVRKKIAANSNLNKKLSTIAMIPVLTAS